MLVILVLTTCATLVVGNDSVTAIRQWAARTPQDVLHRLGARYNPLRGRYAVPSERTFRRVLTGLDGDALRHLTNHDQTGHSQTTPGPCIGGGMFPASVWHER